MCKYYLPSFYLLDAVGPSLVKFLYFHSYFTILLYNLSAHCTLSTVVFSARKHSTNTIIETTKAFVAFVVVLAPWLFGSWN